MTEETRQNYIKDFNELDILYIMGYLWNTESHTYGGSVELNPMDVHILDYIHTHPDCIITDLSTFFKLTLSAASKIVTRLNKKGLIEKCKAPDNKKNIHMVLTPSGLDILAHHEKYDATYYGDKLDQLMKVHSDKDIAAFFDVLKTYIQLIHKE